MGAAQVVRDGGGCRAELTEKGKKWVALTGTTMWRNGIGKVPVAKSWGGPDGTYFVVFGTETIVSVVSVVEVPIDAPEAWQHGVRRVDADVYLAPRRLVDPDLVPEQDAGYMEHDGGPVRRKLTFLKKNGQDWQVFPAE